MLFLVASITGSSGCDSFSVLLTSPSASGVFLGRHSMVVYYSVIVGLVPPTPLLGAAPLRDQCHTAVLEVLPRTDSRRRPQTTPWHCLFTLLHVLSVSHAATRASIALLNVSLFTCTRASPRSEFCDRFDRAFRESLLAAPSPAECGIPTSTECMLFCLCLHPLLSRCFALHLAFRLACGLRLWLTIHQHVLDTLPLSMSFSSKFVIT